MRAARPVAGNRDAHNRMAAVESEVARQPTVDAQRGAGIREQQRRLNDEIERARVGPAGQHEVQVHEYAAEQSGVGQRTRHERNAGEKLPNTDCPVEQALTGHEHVSHQRQVQRERDLAVVDLTRQKDVQARSVTPARVGQLFGERGANRRR
jgi:hypothetical protein